QILSNGKNGFGNGVILARDVFSNTIENNTITDNTAIGIDLEGTGTHDNKLFGNTIQHNLHGVTLFAGAHDNHIGTDGNGVADAAERNLISGNPNGGVLIESTGTTQNVVAGNYIGTNAAGTDGLRNTDGTLVQYDGVQIQDADGNTVGSTTPG